MGSLLGGATAAVTGGDIGQGMLTGAVTGAFFGGAGGIIGHLGREGTMLAHAIHAGAGAASGGVNAAITGGDIGRGMAIGAVSGGIASYAGNYLNGFVTQLVGRSIIGGVTGGITAEIYGGNFGQGFVQGAWTAAFGFLFNETYHGLKKYQEQQRIQREKAQEVLDTRGGKEIITLKDGTKVVYYKQDPITNFFFRHSIRFEGGSWSLITTGAPIASAGIFLIGAAPTTGPVVGFFVGAIGIAKTAVGIMTMIHGLPRVRFERLF